MKRIFSAIVALGLAGCGPTVGVEAARQAGPFSAVYWNPANWDWAGGAAVMGAYSASQAQQAPVYQQPVQIAPITCRRAGRDIYCY